MKETHNFTEGKILGPLMRFAGPILLAMFLQSMYGAVDLLIVGKFASTVDVSAVATGSQMMHSITGVITGLAMGVTILLGQYIGEKKPEQAGKVIGSGIILFLFIAVIMSIIFAGFAGSFASVLRAPEEAYEGTVQYLQICASGIIFITAFNALGSIFRGIGDSKMPLLTVSIACIVNIFGDLLLVAVFKMGAAGAAFATIAAQAVSVLLSFIIISKRELPFRFTKSYIKPDRFYMKKILKYGVPVAMQDALVSLSFLVIMAIINNLGLTKSAGVGVAEKVCGFIMLVPAAYMQALSAYVAQNVGAGKLERAKKALFYSIGTSILAGTVMFYAAFFHGGVLASIFSNDREVIRQAADYLKAYGIDCLLTAELFCFNGYFSGLGKTTFVMLQGIFAAFCIRIPVSWAVSRLPGVNLFHIGLGIPISTIVQILICLTFMLYLSKRYGKGVGNEKD
ncbi:MATE family efflux transporter [Frisingicoccus sp.]|uniref:MATE family efflux transporter n=1 Tax=Frisingicoccus sp. TaxID=1918627 RepID=UPI003AB8A8CE